MVAPNRYIGRLQCEEIAKKKGAKTSAALNDDNRLLGLKRVCAFCSSKSEWRWKTGSWAVELELELELAQCQTMQSFSFGVKYEVDACARAASIDQSTWGGWRRG